METRWYLAPGQTLATTKAEERGLALHVTKDSWKNITRHLDRNRLQQEAIANEIAHKRYLKEGSENMTKNWDNSVENIRKRKEEQRLARIEKVEKDKLERFYMLRGEQQAIKQQYIADQKRRMYLKKENPRSLTSALILSEVLYEREKQKEFDKFLSEHEDEEKAKYAESVKEGARQEELEKKEYEAKLCKNKLEIKELYLNEIHDHEEANRKGRSDRLKREREDIANMDKEFDRINQIEKEDEQERRTSKMKELEDFTKQQDHAKEILRLEDLEQDNIIKIYNHAKHRITCLRKKKEKEIQAELQVRRDAAIAIAVSAAQVKGQEEERILKKAIEERDQLELDRLLVNRKYQERLVKERKEEHARFLKREEQRKFEEGEIMKWKMLNRLKTSDVNDEYNEKLKNIEWQKKLNVRKDLTEQMEEHEEISRKLKEKEEKIHQDYLDKLADEDKQFFEYGKEVMDYASKKGRSTIPIERCIDEYKRKNLQKSHNKKKCTQ